MLVSKLDTADPTFEPTFPCLFECISEGSNLKGAVVLFTSEQCGTAVFVPSNTVTTKLGEHFTSWTNCKNESIWRVFRGMVILEYKD